MPMRRIDETHEPGHPSKIQGERTFPLWHTACSGVDMLFGSLQALNLDIVCGGADDDGGGGGDGGGEPVMDVAPEPAQEAPEAPAAPVEPYNAPVDEVPNYTAPEATPDAAQDPGVGAFGANPALETGAPAAAPAGPEFPPVQAFDDVPPRADAPDAVPTAAPVDPEAALRALPLPDAPLAPPTAADLGTPPAPSTFSELDRFNYQADIAQNYRDLASPPELFQGTRGDCFNVAGINALTARDPDGVLGLAQPTRREGIWGVTTLNPDGQPNHVYTHDGRISTGGDRSQDRGLAGATTSDPQLQAVYNATSLLYHPGQPGGNPAYAMERLGADARGYNDPTAAITDYQNGGAAVLGTMSDRQLQAMDPATRQAFEGAGLVPGHAYQVASVLRHPDGRDYAVLSNPWGREHPQPVPVSDLNRYFNSGFSGRTR